MEDLRAQLIQIQQELHQSGTCTSDVEELTARYAEMLRITTDNTESDPKKLVTDLLARCLIWSKVIEQRYVDFASL